MNTEHAIDKSLKQIHIGKYILQKVLERDIKMARTCNFFQMEEEEIENFYDAEEINTSFFIAEME